MATQPSLEAERRRLDTPPAESDRPGGLGTVRFLARCPGDAPAVLARALEVMRIVNRHSMGDWPTDDAWRALLPGWFVDRCAPEMTREESEAWMAQWRQLPPDEQSAMRRRTGWSLDGWIYWFVPTNRHWYWWDAKVIDPNYVAVAVEVDEWPFPWGALSWLFRAAGAEDVIAEP